MMPLMDRQRAARAVAARRGELGMTQQELAETAGVTSKTIGNLERRGRWPIARNRALIEKALHWPVGEMERLASDDEPPEPELPPEMMAAVDEVTPEGHPKRQLMIDTLRQALADTSEGAPAVAGPGRHRRRAVG